MSNFVEITGRVINVDQITHIELADDRAAVDPGRVEAQVCLTGGSTLSLVSADWKRLKTHLSIKKPA